MSLPSEAILATLAVSKERADEFHADLHAAHDALDTAHVPAGGKVADRIVMLAAERDESRRDAAHLRAPFCPPTPAGEVTDWGAKAIAAAPLIIGLGASTSADRGALRVQNCDPRGPITDSQEGAVEIFLEEGPAAMVRLVAERAAAAEALTATGFDYNRGLAHGIRAIDQDCRVKRSIINLFDRHHKRTRAEIDAAEVPEEMRDDHDIAVRWLAQERAEITATLDTAKAPARKADGTPLSLAERVRTLAALNDVQAALLEAARADIEEQRLEILALRGATEGAVSRCWAWQGQTWTMHDGGRLIAKVAVGNLLVFVAGDAAGLAQATSVRDGMRQAEARLAAMSAGEVRDGR